MDRILKVWADEIRAKDGLIPHLSHTKLKLFQDQGALSKWQNWRSGLKWSDGKGNNMIGALDDVLVDPSGRFVPFDFKTKGTETSKEFLEKYYQRQIDIYALLLSTVGEVADYGAFLNVSPLVVDHTDLSHSSIVFNWQYLEIGADPERAKKLFGNAIDCLNSEIMPPAGEECEYCKHAAAYNSEMPVGAHA
jgi:hypothetical protein